MRVFHMNHMRAAFFPLLLIAACDRGEAVAAAKVTAVEQHRPEVEAAIKAASELEAQAKTASADAAAQHQEAVDRAQAAFDDADDAAFALNVDDTEYASTLAEATAAGDDRMVAALKAAKTARSSGRAVRAAADAGKRVGDAAEALRAAIDARETAKAAASSGPRAQACKVLADVGISDCAGALDALAANPAWHPTDVP